jgi:hypothetical protein
MCNALNKNVQCTANLLIKLEVCKGWGRNVKIKLTKFNALELDFSHSMCLLGFREF